MTREELHAAFLRNRHFVRRAGSVTRFHTARRLDNHEIAKHSWGVINIIHAVDPDARKEVLLAAQYHDVPEKVTGDLPSIVKRANPELNAAIVELEQRTHRSWGTLFELTPVETELLDFADIVELAEQSLDEVELGNRLFWVFFLRANNIIEKMSILNRNPNAREVYRQALKRAEALELHWWSIANGYQGQA
jgi:hypothetical protein